ncbi:hypothetical protein PIB30_050603 [Stylosanthes scabra]|uniref:Uncharacterized protein n=1 Tax=Stylosanthes scabra TaxID=79078 RepID=A0ABU6XHW5_9FABA|nr:hypothetical protein [Stylosanthes scabra]
MGTIPTSPWYYLYDSVHFPRSERIKNRYDLSYDSEPERTLLRRRREARRARQAVLEQQLNMAAENNDDNFNMENQNRITLGQYINPTAESCGSTIRRPAILANNFEPQIFINSVGATRPIQWKLP